MAGRTLLRHALVPPHTRPPRAPQWPAALSNCIPNSNQSPVAFTINLRLPPTLSDSRNTFPSVPLQAPCPLQPRAVRRGMPGSLVIGDRAVSSGPLRSHLDN